MDLCKVRLEQLHLPQDEIEIMKMLEHPNVIKVYEIFEEESMLYLVLELCEGGDLFDFIKKTSVESGLDRRRSTNNAMISQGLHLHITIG